MTTTEVSLLVLLPVGFPEMPIIGGKASAWKGSRMRNMVSRPQLFRRCSCQNTYDAWSR